ncbi:MAG: hypothetical protein Kow0098_29480 [Ignavibacteriaceae bacterium]
MIDFAEQHFNIADDDFEKLIEGIQQFKGLDALVITLKKQPDINTKPQSSQKYYNQFKELASYVDDNYTNNSS